jgi:hypothetical protein
MWGFASGFELNCRFLAIPNSQVTGSSTSNGLLS